MEGLREVGAHLVTVPDPEAGSGIVVFRVYDLA